MRSDCRVCEQPIVGHCKACPHCGVETPTASATETNLDAFRGCANGFFWILLVSTVLCVIAAVVSTFVGGDDEPDHCTIYEIWAAEDAKIQALEAQYGPERPITIPNEEMSVFMVALSRRDAAWERMWELAPESATISSIRTNCTG